eukprot:Hpha_TRINITY_DN22351_c0_g1::TRINITY_DN22351_c0_g1_i1::g.177861::m.177861
MESGEAIDGWGDDGPAFAVSIRWILTLNNALASGTPFLAMSTLIGGRYMSSVARGECIAGGVGEELCERIAGAAKTEWDGVLVLACACSLTIWILIGFAIGTMQRGSLDQIRCVLDELAEGHRTKEVFTDLRCWAFLVRQAECQRLMLATQRLACSVSNLLTFVPLSVRMGETSTCHSHISHIGMPLVGHFPSNTMTPATERPPTEASLDSDPNMNMSFRFSRRMSKSTVTSHGPVRRMSVSFLSNSHNTIPTRFQADTFRVELDFPWAYKLADCNATSLDRKQFGISLTRCIDAISTQVLKHNGSLVGIYSESASAFWVGRDGLAPYSTTDLVLQSAVDMSFDLRVVSDSMMRTGLLKSPLRPIIGIARGWCLQAQPGTHSKTVSLVGPAPSLSKAYVLLGRERRANVTTDRTVVDLATPDKFRIRHIDTLEPPGADQTSNRRPSRPHSLLQQLPPALIAHAVHARQHPHTLGSPATSPKREAPIVSPLQTHSPLQPQHSPLLNNAPQFQPYTPQGGMPIFQVMRKGDLDWGENEQREHERGMALFNEGALKEAIKVWKGLLSEHDDDEVTESLIRRATMYTDIGLPRPDCCGAGVRFHSRPASSLPVWLASSGVTPEKPVQNSPPAAASLGGRAASKLLAGLPSPRQRHSEEHLMSPTQPLVRPSSSSSAASGGLANRLGALGLATALAKRRRSRFARGGGIPSSLVLTIKAARNLMAADRNGLSDPYVEIRAAPLRVAPGGGTDSNDHPVCTTVRRATLNPVWGESFEFLIDVERADAEGVSFNLTLWDWDRVGDNDYMGEVNVVLSKEDFSARGLERTMPVVCAERRPSLEGNLGEVLFSVTHGTEGAKLLQEHERKQERRTSALFATAGRPPRTPAVSKWATAGQIATERETLRKKRIMLVWNIAHLFVLMYNSFFVPVRIAFNDKVESTDELATARWVQLVLEILLDVFVYYVSIYLKFNTPYEENGSVIRDKREIHLHYLKTWFPVDFLGCFPMEIFGMMAAAATGGKLELVWFNPWYRVGRLLNILHLPEYLKLLFSEVFSQPVYGMIVRMLVCLFYVAHMISCIFYTCLEADYNRGDPVYDGDIPRGDTNNEAYNYMGVPELTTQRAVLRYIVSLNWAIHSMTGYSVPYPKSDGQTAVALLTAQVGVFVYAAVLAVVGQLLESLYSRDDTFRQRIDEIYSALAHLRLPPEFRSQVIGFYRTLYQNTGAVTAKEDRDAELFQDLPEQLRLRIEDRLNSRMISQVPMFARTKGDQEAMKFVLELLRPMYVTSEHTVCSIGDEAGLDQMFFITKGECGVYDEEDTQVAVIPAGNYFGELSLFFNVRRTATIRTLSFTQLYVLKASDLEVMVAMYPDMASELVATAETRRPEGAEATKLLKVAKELSDAQHESCLSPVGKPCPTNANPFTTALAKRREKPSEPGFDGIANLSIAAQNRSPNGSPSRETPRRELIKYSSTAEEGGFGLGS